MTYALCIKNNPKVIEIKDNIVFKINADSLQEAREKFIGMKQMEESQFDEIFIVVEMPVDNSTDVEKGIR